MNFAEMTARVQDRLSDASVTTKAIIQDKINETLQEVQERVPTAKWYYRESAFTTRPDSQTGTVQRMLQGSRLIFVTANADIGKHRIGASIRIRDDTNRYTIEDVGLPFIRPAVDFTGGAESVSNYFRYVQLDRPYESSSDTSGGGAHDIDIQQDRYLLRSDVNILAWMVNHQFPQQLFAVDPTIARFYVPDQFAHGAQGQPWMFENLGRRTKVWLDDSVNSTAVAGGAVAAVTNGSPQVTISSLETSHDGDISTGMFGGATIGEALQGTMFRVKGTERFYVISTAEIAADTTMRLLLEERYAGTTVNTPPGVTFEIGPMDAPIVRLYAVPDTAQRISYGYFVRELYPLQADEDRPILPTEHHAVLVDGAIWRMLQFVESQAQHSAFHRYQRGLDRVAKANIQRLDRIRMFQHHRPDHRMRAYNLGANYPPVIVR